MRSRHCWNAPGPGCVTPKCGGCCCWWPASAASARWGVELAAEAAADDGGYGALLQQMATALEQLRAVLLPWLAAHLPVSLEALREAAVTWLRTHASQLQLWGGHTVRGLGCTLAGVQQRGWL